MELPVVAGVGTGDRKSVSQGSRLVEFVSRFDKLWCFVLLGVGRGVDVSPLKITSQ